ncbi:MAG: AAA family ATPase, partial [Candidatus Geothermarchaeales archaeon]
LEGYDAKLKRLKDRENGLRSSMGTLEKEQVGITKQLERTTEIEQGYLSELTLYGYREPIEFFDEAEVLLNQLNNDFESLKGGVNLLADKNYREVFTGYKNLSIRSSQLDKEKAAIVKFIEGIDTEKRKVFIEAYEKIDKELRVIFERLTKGSAWLELEKPDDIFSGGVFLMTQFLDKNPRESAAVSGGEKTVSALSFILAIQTVYPSPFYLFDEIDAHLDAVNAENLAALLKEKAARSQIIVVTLKDAVLAQSSTIYGLYMGNGVSQTVRYTPEMEVTVRHA